ncbi:MAG: FAD-dependent oxidoreductase [Microcoleaceae cyanobacterium]
MKNLEINQNFQTPHQARRALVIGGSMAGLLAARVLTDHFDHVTLAERDRFPQQPQTRRGIPQADHIHVLLTQGERILANWFPGLIEELVAQGASEINWTADCAIYSAFGWQPRFKSHLTTHPCSRNLLGWTVRKHLTTADNLEILDGCRVTELIPNSDHTQIKGVKLSDDQGDQVRELPIDLVVDASGRSSALPKWLTELGYEPPPETKINAFLGYASRWYEIPDTFTRDWQALLIETKPPKMGRAGLILEVEYRRWIVNLAGVGRDYPPTDEAGFLEFARSLRHPLMYETIKDARPISPIYSYRNTENQLRHYEKLSRFPDGVVALGDAVCAFNPIYGQGMTTAALEALTLSQSLQQGWQPGSGADFQRKLAKIVQHPWSLATGVDQRWPQTQGGESNLVTRATEWYMDQVAQLSVRNPNIYQTFAEIIHMLKPPSALFQPNYGLQILSQNLKQL